MQIVFVLLLLFGILIAIVAVQNTTPVTLRFLVFEIAGVAVSVLVLASMAAGAILTLLLGLPTWIRGTRAARERERNVARLEGELARERMSPAAPEAAPPAASLGSSAEPRHEE